MKYIFENERKQAELYSLCSQYIWLCVWGKKGFTMGEI